MFQVFISDSGHKYSCESKEKGRALQFIDWFLDSVNVDAEISIIYRQRPAADGPPPIPAPVNKP
jgi:hypothetical protein